MSLKDIASSTEYDFATVTDTKIVYSSKGTVGKSYGAFTKNTPSFKIKVFGLSNSEYRTLTYYRRDEEGTEQATTITEDGEYTLLESFNTVLGTGSSNGFSLTGNGSTDVIIELLPLYPNALVSDGVDDYAQVAGLPLLTKERGFTVIARRHWIGDINIRAQGLVSKTTDVSFADGAFCFECVEGSGSAPFNSTFATNNPRVGVNYIDEFISGDFSSMTSKKYNSVEFKSVGDGIDTDALAIFRLTTTMNNFYSSIALYSLLLFDRDLASDEIDWVKTNILGEANQ